MNFWQCPLLFASNKNDVCLSQTLPALAHHPACNDCQNQLSFVVDLSLPDHERYLEWRQAEDAQLHVRATTVEMLEEAIKEGVLVLCASHRAYLRVKSDYADYPCHARHRR
jgi:hypothetical protein